MEQNNLLDPLGSPEDINKLVTSTDKYVPIEQKVVVIDKSDGNIEQVREPTHFDRIREISNQHGITVMDPKKDCRKCYGRGYIGLEVKTKMPIPCTCIFPKDNLKKTEQNFSIITPKMRRKYKRELAKKITKDKLKKMQDEFNKLKAEAISGQSDQTSNNGQSLDRKVSPKELEGNNTSTTI